MRSEHFSKNLRRLRLEKGLTQEQLAEKLGVSVQSVSRWECGNTLPDVMLLPEIARLYGVTVDDLYRDNAPAYPVYADRLLAVYEASGLTEDFLAAEQEYRRIPEEELTADILRGWGVLYHYMVSRCASRACLKLEQAMEHPTVTEDVYRSAAQQKIALMCDLGRGAEEADRYERELAKDSGDPTRWLLCGAAHFMMKNYARVLEVVQEGIKRFPEDALLHVYAGDTCDELKRYDEAFCHWEKALELDPEVLAAAYSMGFCHEKLGQYKEAYEVWTKLTGTLDRRGFVVEREFPAARAKECLSQLK